MLFRSRRVLSIGMLLFGVGSLCSALAPDIGYLIAARALQGIGGALVSPSAFALITAFLPAGPERHRALGVFGLTQGFSLVLGLLAGGFLIGTLGWRSVFLLNLPLVAISFVMALRVLPVVEARRDPIDVPGALLGTLAVVALVGGVSAIGRVGLFSPLAIGGFALAIVLGAVFWMVELRAKAPILPPALMRLPSFPPVIWITMLFMAGVGGLMVLVQLHLQRGLGFTPFEAGLATMPYAVAVMLTGKLAPFLLGRFAPRQIVLGSAIVNAAGLIVLTVAINSHYAFGIAPGIVLCALGSVNAFIALMSASTGILPTDQQGVGTAVMFTSQQIGNSLGASLTMAAIGGTGAALTLPAFATGYVVLACGLGVAFLSTLLGMRAVRAVPV